MNQPMSFSMQHKQQQSLKQTQRLIMSPQMQQALHLLQMPVMELSEVISSEMEQNPVLEYEDESNTAEKEEWEPEEPSKAEEASEQEMDFERTDFEILKQLDDEFNDFYMESEGFRPYRTEEENSLQTYLESTIQKPESLFEHLSKQAKDSFSTEEEVQNAELIIGNLDENGFLSISLEEISLLNELPLTKIKKLLEMIQTFSPHGVGARSLQESLLIQLKMNKRKNSLAYKIIENHFGEMLHNKIPVIRKKLNCTTTDIQNAIKNVISKLDLHPGMTFAPSYNQAITPDVTIKIENSEIEIIINEESIPGLKINRKYLKMLGDQKTPTPTQDYIKTKISSGKWLLKNIYQRNETLRNIAKLITKKQKKFFLNSQGKLNPMTMKSIAEKLEIHESTVARACANKYLTCPKGIFTLRSFFTNAYTTDEGNDISATTVKQLIVSIIKDENKKKPLSDESISKKVRESGVSCARRTVAKYRYELSIGNASQRKLFT